MKTLTYNKKGSFGILTIDKPKQLNALDSELIDELRALLETIQADQKIHCLIITGSGEKAFAAGADISEMAEMDEAQALSYAQKGNGLMHLIQELTIPTIAAINGYALGGGCELALACDLRIASENAVFGLPEVGLGITPGFGGTQRLAKIIGVGRAKELIYTAKKMNSQAALDCGLVNSVVPLKDLQTEAEKLAEKISKNAPIAIRLAKNAINGGVHFDAQINLEATNFSQCFSTNDQKEAMKAFLENRPPRPFTNN